MGGKALLKTVRREQFGIQAIIDIRSIVWTEQSGSQKALRRRNSKSGTPITDSPKKLVIDSIRELPARFNVSPVELSRAERLVNNVVLVMLGMNWTIG